MSTSSVDSVSTLASALFKRVDANSDGRLSASEFQGFLDNLLGKVGSQQTPGLGTAAAAVAKRIALAERGYQSMAGFDHAKLNNLGHTTAKYTFARATQEVELPPDRPSRSAGLSKIVEHLKQNGFANAQVVGDDRVDFGDGNGAIDVLTSEGAWWWGA